MSGDLLTDILLAITITLLATTLVAVLVDEGSRRVTERLQALERSQISLMVETKNRILEELSALKKELNAVRREQRELSERTQKEYEFPY